jgi:hypothetical protein
MVSSRFRSNNFHENIIFRAHFKKIKRPSNLALNYALIVYNIRDFNRIPTHVQKSLAIADFN